MARERATDVGRLTASRRRAMTACWWEWKDVVGSGELSSGLRDHLIAAGRLNERPTTAYTTYNVNTRMEETHRGSTDRTPRAVDGEWRHAAASGSYCWLAGWMDGW